MNESPRWKIFQHRFFQQKIFKITIVVLAVLMGGLLVGGVVGYFSLIEKIEAGTLEEVAERLPDDTQSVVVFRGLGEIGRDFIDVLSAIPEGDDDKLEKIEDEYGIDLASPWDLYETGIDPFRPFAIAALRLDVRLVQPELEEGEYSTDEKEPDWDPDRSVTVLMIPVHDEADAFHFLSDLVPKLGWGDGAASETELDMRRETAQGVSFGDGSALGVENGYLFYIRSGDPSFKAADELERVMRVEPDLSLWTTSDFAQQRALTDEDWNLMSWFAPGLREHSLTRYLREIMERDNFKVLASLLSKKVDLDQMDWGAISTVAHLSPELGRLRTVMDLSPLLGTDAVRIGADQQGEAVGNPGVLAFVSGTPLVAIRLTLDTEYFWTDWLDQDELLRKELEALPETTEPKLIENMTGNITVAIMARDNPIDWKIGDPYDQVRGLLPGDEAVPFPIEFVLGIEVKDSSLLIEEMNDWGMPCDESAAEGIRWCSPDPTSAIGISENHLVFAFGVERQAEIDAVMSGKVDSFYATLVEPQGNALTLGPDVHGLVWVEHLAAQSSQSYLNDDIVNWFKRMVVDEIMGPKIPADLLEDIFDLLVRPPAPAELGPALDERVESLLMALQEESDRYLAEFEQLSPVQDEKKAALDELQPAYDAAFDALKLEDPYALAPPGSPEYQLAKLEHKTAKEAAYDVERRSKDLLNRHKALRSHVDLIKVQADSRVSLARVDEHLAYFSIGLQFWEDTSMVIDLELHPKGGDFVSGLLQSFKEEVVER
jgi:hypothetical protein